MTSEPTAQELYRVSSDPATGERIYVRISAREESQIGRLEWLTVLTSDEARDFAEERLQAEHGRTFYEERFRNAIERLGKELYGSNSEVADLKAENARWVARIKTLEERAERAAGLLNGR